MLAQETRPMRVIPNATAGLNAAARDLTDRQRANQDGEAYRKSEIGISRRVPRRRNIQHDEHESKCEQKLRQKRRPDRRNHRRLHTTHAQGFQAAEAIAAPTIWNTMYGATSFDATRPRIQTPSVTA